MNKNRNSIDYSKMSKRQLFKLNQKASHLVTRWTEAVIMMAAELFIIFPQHEIFKGEYFVKNTLILVLKRVQKMLEITQIKRVVIEFKDGSVTDHSPETIERIIKEREGGLIN